MSVLIIAANWIDVCSDAMRLTYPVCRFLTTFVEPMSHTILYGLVKAWLELICKSNNGVEVDGVPFHLHNSPGKKKDQPKDSEKLIERIVRLMRRIKLTSAYNRDLKLLPSGDDGCDNQMPSTMYRGVL